MPAGVVVEQVSVQDELFEEERGVFGIPDGGGDYVVAFCEGGEDLAFGGGREGEDGGYGVQGVEGGDAVVEEVVAFGGEVCG